MIKTLFRIELMKIRRSMVRIMTLACPMTVALLVFTLGLHRYLPNEVPGERVDLIWSGTSIMWSVFMLPLYIALVTSLINGNEHRNQTWRLMLSLPVSRVELYVAKLLVAAMLLLCAHLMVCTMTALGIGAIHLIGYDNSRIFNAQAIQLLWAAPLASLPVLVIQHSLSWLFSSIVPPLAIAIIATFAALQLGNSEHWFYLPWAYPLVSTSANSGDAQGVAVTLALVMAAALLLLSFWMLRRREIV